jgi:UDP-arabinose 4-epimerase
MTARNILVTGGAGYIGSHTCKALAQAGFTPVAFDNLVYGHREAVRFGPFVQADILDRAALNKALAEYRPEAVLHFAAFAYVGESVSDPGKYYQNNVSGTLNLLQAMHQAGCPHLVFSSSCAVYGVPERLPITEDQPLRPISPYGRTKLMVEQMLADFDVAHGLRSVCLRYFNAAGADPDCELGEDHTPETHLLPLVLREAMTGAGALCVFGDDYDTPDGTCVRDYIHVTDLAQAHVLALKHLRENQGSARFNLGNGEGHSIRQVLDAARAITGKPIAARQAARRPGDPPFLVGSSELARKVLGWSPAHHSIEEILSTAWAWHQKLGKV